MKQKDYSKLLLNIKNRAFNFSLLNFFLYFIAIAFPLFSASGSDREIATYYSVRCAECHGHNGISSASYIPDIGGQKLEYLATQLKDFRDGLRSGSAMPTVVRRMTNDDLNALAEYISTFDRCTPKLY